MLLIVAVLRSQNLLTGAGLGSAVIVATPLILATYALMAQAIAGRGSIDLSIGPLIGFINVTLVQLYGADIISSPVPFFLAAFLLGIAYQLLMGLIIVFVRVQPIIVSLSGYLALSGINLVILERPGGTVPEWMSSWGLGMSVFSPVTAILVLSTLAWVVYARSAFFGHLRLMGSDERAAYASGVRIGIVRLGAHVISGIYAALAALTYTSLIGSGDPSQGTTYTLIAITALVLGGTSLAGGRGGVVGSLLGAVNIYLIGFVLGTLNFGAVQSFVTDLSYGVILVLSLLLTVVLPRIQSVVRGISPLLLFVALSAVAGGVAIHSTYDYSAPAAPAQSSAAATAAGSEAGATVVKTPADGTRFMFEDSGAKAVSLGTPSTLAGPLTLGAVVLLALVILLRTMVSQVRTEQASLVVSIVAACVVALGVYAVARPSHQVPGGAVTPAQAEQ
ncbi:MAG: ABC transporter permease [Kiloniellaceae bacterium]